VIMRMSLDSLEWVPLAVVVKLWGERNNSLELGEADVVQVLRAGKVQSMCRCLGAQPERWLVPSEFWNGREIFVMSDGSALIEPAPQPFGHFFCWQPDLERMLGAETKAKRQPSRPAAEEPARQGAPLKHDWFAIVTEVAFREANATKKERARSDLAEAKSVRWWCGRQLKKQPPLVDLRAIVKIVRRRFRGPK
jgi:hypothetical protein